MKTITRHLIKLPTQIFEMGELGDDFEFPLQFQAYHDSIGIEQEGRSIVLPIAAIEPFIKALRIFKKECYVR